ncbi:MAG: ribbon-helix-helix protein, CopG family [Bacillota bacterium]|uniref:ribbon-helix-helix protein, CopG family n=1 Tax=Bacillaceae TaxID=186817 RepID=UPI000BA6230D|nr:MULTISPECIES: ribbon-helix-helix protein, CopG family [Bacillaceae]PAE23166.1 hypothetical protein CHI10_19405 [Bacillus sp. 7894-2]URM32946.1 ribbon-helix-helix protein, CopG family [Cytobacillus firmus]
MKELTFKSYDQFLQFNEHKAMEKAVMKGLQGDELVKFKLEFLQRAKTMWKEYDCDLWLEKHGYVIINVWKDGSGKRKVTRGRPKKLDSEKYVHTVHVRLDEETYRQLTNHCQDNQIDVSEAIRCLIKTL